MGGHTVYSKEEKSLFTSDGNIKRYKDGDKIDKFKEGQMATTTYPNGYGHGPRTHDESIALNTIDRPSVKVRENEKLIPKEIMFQLMGLCDIIDNESIGVNLDEERYKKICSLLQVLWQEIGKKEIQWEIRRFWCVQKEKVLQRNLYGEWIFENWKKLPSTIQAGTPISSNNYEEFIEQTENLRDMWKIWKVGYTSQRWGLSQQQFEQLDVFMQELSQQTTPKEKDVYNLWETSKGIRLLHETLLQIQKIWGSNVPQKQSNLRIRKLVPLETLKLMGFTREDYEAMRKAGMSDAALYHVAGDSIIVTCLMGLFGELLDKDTTKEIEQYVEKVKES